MVSLQNKRILFFCPKTFNYETEIIGKLREMGAEVVFRSAQPVEHSWFKALIRLFPRIGLFVADFFYEIWLKNSAPSECDFVFIVKGEGLSPCFLNKMKMRYPNAKFILYLWDSLANVLFTEKKLNFFDVIFSFDRSDCAKYPEFRYRPLFFLDKYFCNHFNEKSEGIFFVGTLNGDRASVINRLTKSFGVCTLNYWLFARSKIELLFRYIFDSDLRGLARERLIFKPMTAQKIRENYEKAFAILDIEHPGQTGLTMRTFEVLASGKKLITTNPSIADHDFFSNDRIAVIDRASPLISQDFMKRPPAPLSENFLNRYSIKGWLSEIFEAI